MASTVTCYQGISWSEKERKKSTIEDVDDGCAW